MLQFSYPLQLWHDLKLEKESCIKQSATSVVDFEERLSSVDRTNMPNTGEPNLETLSIKQKIEMFSQQQNLERQKPPTRKQQIRINSEPLFDNKSLDEAVKMMKKAENNSTSKSDSDGRNSIVFQDQVSVKSYTEENGDEKSVVRNGNGDVKSQEKHRRRSYEKTAEEKVPEEKVIKEKVKVKVTEEKVAEEQVTKVIPDEHVKIITSSPPPPVVRLTFPEPPKEPYFDIPQSMKTHEELIKGSPLPMYCDAETQPEQPPLVAPRVFQPDENGVSVIHSSPYDSRPPPISYSNQHNETVISINPYTPKEEHGKIVQTINQHLLASTFCDDSDLLECRSYGKNLDSGSNVDKFKSSTSHHNFGHKNFDIGGFECVSSSSKRMECDSELSRTISRVDTTDIINNKEHIGSTKVVVTQKNSFIPSAAKKQELPPKTVPKVTNIDKSYSNDSINRLHTVGMPSHGVMRSDVSLDSFLESADPHPKDSKYSSLQEKHLRAAYKDCCDTFSNKSYSSSEYSEASMASRPDLPPQDRQTLPKVGAKHAAQSPPVPPPRPSLSKPPNACYRAIMAARSLGKASPKTQRKKNALLSSKNPLYFFLNQSPPSAFLKIPNVHLSGASRSL